LYVIGLQLQNFRTYYLGRPFFTTCRILCCDMQSWQALQNFVALRNLRW